jgi:hypothetical protein
VPARLLRNQEALVKEKDAAFRHLAITHSANRLARIQRRSEQLEEIVRARAAAAIPEHPGDHTGLLLKKTRSIKIGRDAFREVIDLELDSALLVEERQLERAAAIETGEWLAQNGKGAFGSAEGGRGPLVVVLSSGLQMLPGDAPDTARHRIMDARRKATPTAAESEAIPLAMVDVELPSIEECEGASTREGTLSGLPDEE